jgi:hypothetical protein
MVLDLERGKSIYRIGREGMGKDWLEVQNMGIDGFVVVVYNSESSS